MEKIKVVKHGYHRNGVCGTGFAVATFKWRDELVKDNVEFANGNSWRGDHFEDSLRQAMDFNIEA